MIKDRDNDIAPERDCPVVMAVPIYRSYAFTLRKTKNPDDMTKTHYVNHLSKLISTGLQVKHYIFEESAGLHCHGVALLPESFNPKYLRFRNWHLYLKEIYDPLGWQKYLLKEQNKNLLPTLETVCVNCEAVSSGNVSDRPEAELI